MSQQTIPTEWNLSPLLSSDTDPKIDELKNELISASKAFVEKWKSNTQYLSDPDVLKAALDEYEQWEATLGSGGKLAYYFLLRSVQEKNNPQIKAEVNKLTLLTTEIVNEMQFFTLQLAKIPETNQKLFLESDQLREYKHFLEKLFTESKYLLTDAEEKILNLKAQPSHSNWVTMLSDFLSKEERTVTKSDGTKGAASFSELMSLIKNTNRDIRDEAAGAINEIFTKHEDVAEAEINSILLNKQIDDSLRGIDRPDRVRHISDDIDSDVVDALVQTVADHFTTSHKYYELKAKLLKLPKLKYHERTVPYGKIDKEYSYDNAVSIVQDVFTNVDSEFGEIFNGFVKSGNIDVYPKKGKENGAFCVFTQKVLPTYIMLNFTNTLYDVAVLAHECGHGINNELIKGKQNALNCVTPTSTAEVASTLMEHFVLDKLIADADDELRLALQMMQLDDTIASIHRQIAAYRFETELHSAFREAGYLPKEEIGKLFTKHMESYMGPFVEQSPGSHNWWIYWSHFRNFFYVYSYASGILISHSLYASVKKDPTFISKVKTFLSSGGIDSPKNLFAAAGIDISSPNFWKQGLEEINTLLSDTEALAKKLNVL